MKRIFSAFGFLLFAAVIATAQLTFSVNDLLGVKRVGDPQVSPDGKTVAFTVGTVDKVANRVLNQIFTVNIDGTRQRQITTGNSSSTGPRWSPDGKRIAYNNGGQIWAMKPDGTDREQVTRLSSGGGGAVWSADGKWIAFSSEVYPECQTDACNKAEDEKAENSKVKAHVTERLLFKHWNEWRERKRAHVFYISSNGGAAVDLTPGDFDSPPYAAASGVDYSFSPDGSSIAFLRNPDRIEATSTNSDVYLLPLSGGSAKNITSGRNGYEASPTWTPDGKYLLFRSQATATFEADRWRIMRYNPQNGEIVELTRGFDQQVDEMTVSNDSKTIYFAAGERGHSPIFTEPVEPDVRLKTATHVKNLSTASLRAV